MKVHITKLINTENAVAAELSNGLVLPLFNAGMTRVWVSLSWQLRHLPDREMESSLVTLEKAIAKKFEFDWPPQGEG